MEFSLLHIVFFASAVLMIALAYVLRWRDYRLPLRWQGQEAGQAEVPAVSIVIPAHNQAPQLEENLPHFMSQKFEKYEIIIVDIHSTDDTAEVMKRLERSDVILRHVRLPETSRYIGKNRLAMSLGIRAAHFPWVVFAQPDSRPQGDTWLAAMAREMKGGRNIVIGYANYEDVQGRAVRRAVYERMRRVFTNLRALRRGKAIDADACNFAIRKSFYMEEHPLSSKLTVPFGEVPLLADAYGHSDRTGFAVSPEAAVVQQAPHRSTLASQRMYMAETERHLSRRARLYHIRESLASWCIYTFAAIMLSYFTLRLVETITGHTPTLSFQLSTFNFQLSIFNFHLSIPAFQISTFNFQLSTFNFHLPIPALQLSTFNFQLSTFNESAYPPFMLLYDVPMFLLLVLAILLPVLLLRKTCRRLNVRPFGLRPMWYDLTQPFRTLAAKLQRWRHRKDFVRPIISSAE